MLTYLEIYDTAKLNHWDKHRVTLVSDMWGEFEEKKRREIGYNWKDGLAIHRIPIKTPRAITARKKTKYSRWSNVWFADMPISDYVDLYHGGGSCPIDGDNLCTFIYED